MKEETLLSFLKDEHNKCSLALINEDLKQVRKRLITCMILIDKLTMKTNKCLTKSIEG